LLLLWSIAGSSWVDRRLSTVIEAALGRWSDLDARDYVRLLDISSVYAIAEIVVHPDDWLEGRAIGDVLIAKEGVVVLGLRRGRSYLGAPTSSALIRAGDVIVVYGRTTAIADLDGRQGGDAGDLAHRRAADEHEHVRRGAAWTNDLPTEVDVKQSEASE
jgi:K+/H+ antiporter YhaU regulatory subunit KhtT